MILKTNCDHKSAKQHGRAPKTGGFKPGKLLNVEYRSHGASNYVELGGKRGFAFVCSIIHTFVLFYFGHSTFFRVEMFRSLWFVTFKFILSKLFSYVVCPMTGCMINYGSQRLPHVRKISPLVRFGVVNQMNVLFYK